jgi:hypothetical protein
MPLLAIVVDDTDELVPVGVPFNVVALAHVVITSSGKVLKDRNGTLGVRRARRAARLLGKVK